MAKNPNAVAMGKLAGRVSWDKVGSKRTLAERQAITRAANEARRAITRDRTPEEWAAIKEAKKEARRERRRVAKQALTEHPRTE